MTFRTKSFISIMTAFLTFSCGALKSEKDSAKLSDVGTSTGKPGSYDYLYWIEDGWIVHARCEKGKPLLRKYCQDLKAKIETKAIDRELTMGRRTQKSKLQIDRAELQTELTAIDEALAADPTSVDLSRERVRVVKELVDVSSKLAAVTSEIQTFESLIQKMTRSDIVFRMVDNDDSYSAEKPFLKYLSRYFPNHDDLDPQPSPDNPVFPSNPLMWVDEISGRSFIAFQMPMNYQAALATCESIGPGKWTLLNHSNSALLNSPVVAAIPFANDAHAKSVWLLGSLGVINNHALRINYEGFKPLDASVFLTNSGHLMPVICQDRF